MIEKNRYLQKIIQYLSDLTNQRAVLYLAIGGVSICLILIVLGFIFPKGIPTENTTVADKPNTIVETYAGITSTYTANQAIDFVTSAINSDEINNPRCSTDQGKLTTFFSHRRYWKVALLCPPDPANGIHAWTEHTYEFNEQYGTVKDTTLQ
tara:strand:- start:1965 stop:2420 length:456 start_codon:yes stop_codon:yes gene_type:complete